jgi:signal transduction histidine kinase
MSAHGGKGDRQHPAALMGAAVLVCAAMTVAVAFLPFVRFAYQAPALQVALETSNALIALVVAYLVYGRFRESRRLQELLLVLALCTVAVANLVLTALPVAVFLAMDVDFSRWAALGVRLMGTLLLTGAALTPSRARIRRRRAVAGVASLAGLVLVVGLAGLAFGGELPEPVDPSLVPADASRPILVGHPAVLAVHTLGALLYGVSAVALTRQAQREQDELLRWVGIGCVLAAFARVHYLLFPSLYSEFVYTGDLLRLGFYLLLLVGAAREVRSYWEARTHAAVLQDRRRMARDLHDGLTQELAYISTQSQRLRDRPDPAIAGLIRAAAQRAVDEARQAISALSRPPDEPFPVALQRMADDMAHRYDVKVVSQLDAEAHVDHERAEALLRIVAESVRNAVHHGAAELIELRLTAAPLCLAIIDDGRGFDARSGRPGGFGLTSMRERAEAMGAEFEVSSEAGCGTTVRVTWR